MPQTRNREDPTSPVSGTGSPLAAQGFDTGSGTPGTPGTAGPAGSAGSGADLQSQLAELQKRFSHTPSRSGTRNGTAGGPVTPSDLPPLPSPSRRQRAMRAANRTPSDSNKTPLGSSPAAASASGSSSSAVVTPNSPGRVDFLSDLSDGLLVESRRLAYENKRYKKQVAELEKEKQSLQMQSSNLSVMNKTLAEKESQSNDRIWELESQLASTKESLDRAQVSMDKLQSDKQQRDVQLDELNSNLESSKANSLQRESGAAAQVAELSKRVKELQRSNLELNDENDELTRQVKDLEVKAAVNVKPITFTDALDGLVANEDDEANLLAAVADDNASLFTAEPSERALLSGEELERATLEDNLRHSIKTIHRLRRYIMHTRQMDSTMTVPGLQSVRRRLFSPDRSSIKSGATGGATAGAAEWDKFDQTSVSMDRQLSEGVDDSLDDVTGEMKLLPATEYQSLKESEEKAAELDKKLGDLEKQLKKKSEMLSDSTFLQSRLREQGFVPLTKDEHEDLQERVDETARELAAVQLEVGGHNSERQQLEKTINEKDVVISGLEKEVTTLQGQIAKPDADYIREKSGSLGLVAVDLKDKDRTDKQVEQLKVSQSDLKDTQKKLRDTESNLTTTQKKLDATQKQLDSVQARAADLESQLTKSRDATKELNKKVSDLQGQLKTDASEISALRSQLNTVKTSYDKQTSELSDLQTKHVSLQKSHDAPDADYFKSKSASLGFTAVPIDEYKQLQQQLEAQTKQLYAQTKQLEAQRTTLESNNKQLEETSSKLQDRIACLEKTEKELTAAKASAEKNTESYETSLFNKQQEYEQVKRELLASEKQLATIQEEHKNPDSDYIRGKASTLGFAVIPQETHEQTKSDLSDAQRQLSDLQDSMAEMAQENQQLTTELQTYKQTLTTTNKQLETAKSGLASNEKAALQVVSLQSELDSEKKLVESLQSQVASLKAESSQKDTLISQSKESYTSDLSAKDEELLTSSQKLDSTNLELADTKKQLAAASLQLKELQSQLDSTLTNLKQLQSARDTPDEDYIKEKSAAKGLVVLPSAEHDAIKTKVADQQKQIDQLQSSVSQPEYIKSQASTLGLAAVSAAEYASLKKQLSDKSAALEAEDKETAALREQLDQSRADLQEAKTKLDTIASRGAQNDNLLAEKSQRIAELNTELEQKSVLLDQHSAELEASQKQVSQLRKSIDSPDLAYLQTKANLLGVQVVPDDVYNKYQSDSKDLAELQKVPEKDDLEIKASDLGYVLVPKKEYEETRDATQKLSSPTIDFLVAKLKAQGYKSVDADEYAKLVQDKESLEGQQLPVSNKEFSDVLRSIRLLGGDFSDAADQLEKGQADGLTSLRLASAERAREAATYNSPSIEYLQSSAGNLGMKVLTMGEYLDLKNAGNEEDDDDDDDSGSQVSEEPLVDGAEVKASLASKSKDIAQMQSDLQVKEKELQTLRECMDGANDIPEGTDENVVKIAKLRKRLGVNRHDIVILKSKLGELSHSGKRLSLKQMNMVDQTLDRKRQVLQSEKEALESRQAAAKASGDQDSYDQATAALSNKSSALMVLEAYIASNKKEVEAIESGDGDEATRLKKEITAKEQECDKLNAKLDTLVGQYVPILNQRDEEIRQLKESLATTSAEVTLLESKVHSPQTQPDLVAKSDYDAALKQCEEQQRELDRLKLTPTQMAQRLEAIGYSVQKPGSVSLSPQRAATSAAPTSAPSSAPIASNSLGSVKSRSVESTASDYEDAVSSQNGDVDSTASDYIPAEGEEIKLREDAAKLGYMLVPMDDIDTTTIGTAEVIESPENPQTPTRPTSGRSSAPGVSAGNLASLAASLDLALVPSAELAELQKRNPANVDQVSAAAKDLNMIVIPESQFVATTVCRHPDPDNVTVVPSSYYSKLIRAHEWCKTHKNSASGESRNVSSVTAPSMDLTSIQSSAPGTVANVPRSSKSAPQNSPAYALAQLGGKGQMDSYSLHTVNTVISSKREMIAAITQTIIGEYLFKYYRKLGPFRSVSESRHERYFWIHPYSLTLYWAPMNPSLCDPSENKVNAMAITKVRSVDDNNPLPPGLYHKSIIVYGNDRKSVKITCPTRQRHNIWYNSIKYLLEKSTENLLDDSNAENQYAETFTLDQKTQVERSATNSFRHQQPRGSILGSLRLARGETRSQR